LEELHKEIEVFEKRSAALEAELADTTTAFSDKDLVKLKHEIGAALLGAGPEQVKELLSVVVREISPGQVVHPAVLRRARGSYARTSAEADGNRTRPPGSAVGLPGEPGGG